jgi:surface protein
MMPYWDVSAVTDMSEAFKDKDTFNADLSSWDVSSVENMQKMFNGASSFNQDISGWNVGSSEAVAPLNILVVVTASEEPTFHPEISWLKLDAPLNIFCIFSTLETSQLERSALKVSLSLNASDISVTAETSQYGIMPM